MKKIKEKINLISTNIEKKVFTIEELTSLQPIRSLPFVLKVPRAGGNLELTVIFQEVSNLLREKLRIQASMEVSSWVRLQEKENKEKYGEDLGELDSSLYMESFNVAANTFYDLLVLHSALRDAETFAPALSIDELGKLLSFSQQSDLGMKYMEFCAGFEPSKVDLASVEACIEMAKKKETDAWDLYTNHGLVTVLLALTTLAKRFQPSQSEPSSGGTPSEQP